MKWLGQPPQHVCAMQTNARYVVDFDFFFFFFESVEMVYRVHRFSRSKNILHFRFVSFFFLPRSIFRSTSAEHAIHFSFGILRHFIELVDYVVSHPGSVRFQRTNIVRRKKNGTQEAKKKENMNDRIRIPNGCTKKLAVLVMVVELLLLW